MKNKKNLETTDFIVSQTQISLDLKMVSFDVQGTIAHVLMLYKQNIINKSEEINFHTKFFL